MAVSGMAEEGGISLGEGTYAADYADSTDEIAPACGNSEGPWIVSIRHDARLLT
jgi:hypothetical protein